MPPTRKHIQGERPPQQGHPREGIVIGEENVRQFLTDYERTGRTERTVPFYRRRMKRLYGDWPECKTARLFDSTGLLSRELPKITMKAGWIGQVICAQNQYEQTMTVPNCLQKGLLDYAKKNRVLPGLVFQARDRRPMHQTCVSAAVRSLCEKARILSEKESLKALRKVYLLAKACVESATSLFGEWAVKYMTEQGRFSVGWEDM